jgi:exosortase/archaeosortase family protein
MLLVVGLFAWSATSPRVEEPSPGDLRPHLAASVLLRFAGERFAVQMLSALALVPLVYAVAHHLDLGRRRRAVSPLWLATLSALTLPVEYATKRLFGYGLQQLATDSSCTLLGVVYSDLRCGTVDIVLRDAHVFVDAPCSGARGLLLFLILFAALAAVLRPSTREAGIGAGLAVVVALGVNALRVSLLAAGLIHEATLGFDVMEHPWHMTVGLACLAVGCIPMGLWARYVTSSSEGDASDRDGPQDDSADPPSAAVGLVAAAAFLGASVAAVLTPGASVDADSGARVDVPDRLAGHRKRVRELRPVAREHFEPFGGDAVRAEYGPHTLVVVETPTPLRHLHAPNGWLGDAGYDVEKTGRIRGRLPAASYRVEAPEGRRLRVEVTFVSSRGRIATSVPEAIWYGLSSPGSTWRAFYRIRPAETPPARLAAFDRHLAGSLDLPRRPLEAPRSMHEIHSSHPFDSTRNAMKGGNNE